MAMRTFLLSVKVRVSLECSSFFQCKPDESNRLHEMRLGLCPYRGWRESSTVIWGDLTVIWGDLGD